MCNKKNEASYIIIISQPQQNMKTLLTSICLMVAAATFAQNQSADYNRLSAATKNAFSVAERQYTYKIETKYVTHNYSEYGI